MPPSSQPVIIADFTHIYNNGLKEYFYDNRESFKPLYAVTLQQVGELLRQHGPVPVLLTDTFVTDRKPACILKIKGAVPGVKVIVLAEHFMPGLRYLPDMGADALVSKRSTFAELKSIILKTATATHTIICSTFKNHFANGSDTIETGDHVLSQRDLDLVLMSLEWHTDKEIGAKLMIEPNTVAKYRKAIINMITVKWGYKNALHYIDKKQLLVGRY